MDEAYRTSHDQAAFEAAASALPGLVESTDATVQNRSVNGATATIGGVLAGPSGSTPFTLSLHDEAGTWVIDSVTVGAGSL
jgi:hypothetical protein